MKKVKIIIVEDNRLRRDGIAIMINKQTDMHVVAALEHIDKAEPKIVESKPDIVLIDLGLEGKNSLRLVKSIKQKSPKIKLIVMDLLPLQEDIIEFIKAGASGFILKDAGITEFLKTIRCVYKGEEVLPPNLMGTLFSQIVNEALNVQQKPDLIGAVRMTKRERQVIELVADGLTNKEIGQKLHLSPYTVKSHVHNILEKLAIHNRIEIAMYAQSHRGFTDIRDLKSSISLMGEPTK